MEWIEELDRSLLLWINGSNSPFMDEVMWFISGKIEWLPLYLVLAYFVVKRFGKQSWIIFLFVAILITLSDQVSVHLFKNLVERYRPCQNLEIADMLHLVKNKCGGKYGFVSSHAANSFALASFLGMLFNRSVLIALFFWATLVSFSRVYLGVHYPTDVVGGALLGMGLAYLLNYWMFQLYGEKLK